MNKDEQNQKFSNDILARIEQAMTDEVPVLHIVATLEGAKFSTLFSAAVVGTGLRPPKQEGGK